MAKTGRPRIPTALKKLRGSYRKDRAVKDEMELPPATPGMPKEVAADREARAEWERVVPELEKARVLSDVDRTSLANYCINVSLALRATAQYNREGIMVKLKGGRIYRPHPAIAVAMKARAACLRIAIEFGMTPAARSRVSSSLKPSGTSELERRISGVDDGVPLFGLPRSKPPTA